MIDYSNSSVAPDFITAFVNSPIGYILGIIVLNLIFYSVGRYMGYKDGLEDGKK